MHLHSQLVPMSPKFALLLHSSKKVWSLYETEFAGLKDGPDGWGVTCRVQETTKFVSVSRYLYAKEILLVVYP
jgi:hypothetical protein